MTDTPSDPGILASNPSSAAVAATAFVANACALVGVIAHLAPGVTAAITVTATSAVGLFAALTAHGKVTPTVKLEQLARMLPALAPGGARVLADIKAPVTSPPATLED